MTTLQKLAHFQNRRDEIPNQELARELAASKNSPAIREIAENLWSKDRDIQADCIKVLYEIGYLDPALIADYAEDFIKLLKSRNNRLVWGGMIALATVAELKAGIIFTHLVEIQKAMETGSVITVDNGVLALARAASKDAEYNAVIFPYLLSHLKTCRPKDLAQHAEKTLPAANAGNRAGFVAALEKRMEDVSGSGLSRLKRVIKQASSR